MTSTSTSFSPKAAIITPATAPWTQAAVNALKARIGYSTEIAPLPLWHSVLLEYEVGL